jgi:CDP-paratose 2-epimerase
MAKVLITGGLGFIGSNLADKLLREEHEVRIVDNLSRTGCENNLHWLKDNHSPTQLRVFSSDLNEQQILKEASGGAELIFHLAGQVSVSGSVANPYRDFMDNATGTINILEAARKYGKDPILIYSSTNKVYGDLDHIQTEEQPTRYTYSNLPNGIAETQPLDFTTPYGCSKGAGDQYVHDYAGTFGMRTIVMRQSCIYGGRQFGYEGQGWISWLLIASILGLPVNIYGNGKQVRDVLYISDLLDAYESAIKNIETTKGGIYNIGGGMEHTRSIWEEFGKDIATLTGKEVKAIYEPARIGDQKVYISDIRKAAEDFGWKPAVGVEEGVAKTYEWLLEYKDVFQKMYA